MRIDPRDRPLFHKYSLVEYRPDGSIVEYLLEHVVDWFDARELDFGKWYDELNAKDRVKTP